MPIDDVSLEELSNLFAEGDRHQREQRTLRHEAGHAAVAWLLRGDANQPPFEYIEVGTMREHAGGVVPGGVKYDEAWFDTLSPLEQGAILLAGVYVQDGRQHDPHEWRRTLDALDGTDGVDDYARAINVCREAGLVQADFDEGVRAHLAGLPNLNALLDAIASTLKPGQRTAAAAVVATVHAWMPPGPASAPRVLGD